MADAPQQGPNPMPGNQEAAVRDFLENLVPPDQLDNVMNGLLGILQPNPPLDPQQLPPADDEDPPPEDPNSDDPDEKKKPRLAKFEGDSKVPDQLHTLYPRYAMEKLRKFEYIELWYFTPEGRSEERSVYTSAADDALGLARIGSQVTLKPFSSILPSKKAIPDKDLSWLQFTMAYPNLLSAMEEAGWEKAYYLSLGDFFLALAHHELTFQPDSFSALLLHQAEVRLSWHDSLRHKKVSFNIANINDNLLRNYHRRVQDAALHRLRVQVRQVALQKHHHLLLILFSLFFHAQFPPLLPGVPGMPPCHSGRILPRIDLPLLGHTPSKLSHHSGSHPRAHPATWVLSSGAPCHLGFYPPGHPCHSGSALHERSLPLRHWGSRHPINLFGSHPQQSEVYLQREKGSSRTRSDLESSGGNTPPRRKKFRKSDQSPKHRSSHRGKSCRESTPDSPPKRNKSYRRDKSSSPSPGSFRSSRGSSFSVCAVCLGRHQHNVSKCSATTLWNGGPVGCKRDKDGYLVNLQDQRLCIDFQRPRSCSSPSHKHYCSGCGSREHGAHACHLAQKA